MKKYIVTLMVAASAVIHAHAADLESQLPGYWQPDMEKTLALAKKENREMDPLSQAAIGKMIFEFQKDKMIVYGPPGSKPESQAVPFTVKGADQAANTLTLNAGGEEMKVKFDKEQMALNDPITGWTIFNRMSKEDFDKRKPAGAKIEVAGGDKAPAAGKLEDISAQPITDTFGTGANQIRITFVDIGNPGNAADDTGFGAVAYPYRISKFEISEAMIAAYNAAGAGPLITTDNRGPDKPATFVSWNQAARFVNWLNTSHGHPPAYKFTSSGANDHIALWVLGDGSAYNRSNRFRNPNAIYFLPSENEWYKAAYYDPKANGGSGRYWDYATGSDTAPIPVAGGTAPGTAVYKRAPSDHPADITNAGGLSPYGTMAQAGNVSEWLESTKDGKNNWAIDGRAGRDGYWFWSADDLKSSYRFGNSADVKSGAQGFRVASVQREKAPVSPSKNPAR